MKKAFTLIELLVTVAIFSTIVAMVSGFFVSAIRAQRRVLATQELLDQTSYVLEYMGRLLRMARKQLPPTPECPTICLSQNGLNYEKTINGIKFIDYNCNCTEFFLDIETGQLKKRVGVNSWELTSSKIKVNQFLVNLSGAAQTDDLQPRVTIFLEILGRGKGGYQPKIQIQTTISQRNLDVKY